MKLSTFISKPPCEQTTKRFLGHKRKQQQSDKNGIKQICKKLGVKLDSLGHDPQNVASNTTKGISFTKSSGHTIVPRSYWDDESVQRDALEKFGREYLGVKELDDWYSIRAAQVSKLNFIKYKYNSSLFKALKTLYPHHDWNPLRLRRVPVGYWDDEDIQRAALERLGREHLGVKELDDWYAVSTSDVLSKLSFIGEKYGSSLFKALQRLYPHHNWDPLRCVKVPRGYWDDENAQRAALERYAKGHGVKSLNDWYSVNSTDVFSELSFIGTKYNGSLITALKHLYPQHDWDPLQLKAPRGYWDDENAQRDALERYGREHLGIQQLDDWHSVRVADVLKEFSFINKKYNGSLFTALKTLYPHHNWDPLKRPKAPHKFWEDENVQRHALEKFGRDKFGVTELDDWYAVSSTEALNEMSFIKDYYHGSLFHALKALYPNHNWDPVQFAYVHHGYWQQLSTRKHYKRLFMQWKTQYNIQQLKDWYNLPPKQLKLFQRASRGIFGSVTKMLQKWFPKTRWVNQLQSSNPEMDLQMMLKLVTDVNVHQRIGKFNVDLFIPYLNVAIEYQGKQHFSQHWRGDFSSQKERDEAKHSFLQKETVCLLPINYTWNGTWSQLKSTLRSRLY